MKKMEEGAAARALPDAAPGPVPAMPSSAAPRARVVRTDQRTRDLVNQAVASVPTLGLQRAAEFLASVNVPAEIAVRTLMDPQRRRRV